MRRSHVAFFVGFAVAALLLAGCRGPEVPDVVGMTQADAVRTLQAEGFLLGDVSFVATTSVPLGMIAGQQPAAGERADEGSPVALAIASRNGTRVQVPTVTGMSQVTAEGVANTLGLVPIVHEEYSDQVEAGQVFQQLPEPGAEVNADSPLVLVVAKGSAPEKAQVPDVVGDSESSATGALTDAGFPSEVIEVFDSSVAKGDVIAQIPEGGSSALVGSKVQIAVSLGKGTGAAKMPAVKGKRESDAVSSIQSAGLKARKVYQYSSSVGADVVIEQFPASGATVATGSEALIVVSRGAEPANETVSVPDVVGDEAAAATSALEKAGFSVTTEELPSEGATGTVLYQFPLSGTTTAPGVSVLIVVGAS